MGPSSFLGQASGVRQVASHIYSKILLFTQEFNSMTTKSRLFLHITCFQMFDGKSPALSAGGHM